MVKRSLSSEAVLAWAWRRREQRRSTAPRSPSPQADRTRIDAALGELPDGCVGTALDVRDETQVASFFERVGEFDHLAFTAGDAFLPRPLADLELSDARAILDVRFWGAVAVIKYAAPRIRPGGSIGLTTGTIGQRPVPGAALAAAGAGAAEGLVRGLAVELAPVRVNAVRAGLFARHCGTASPRPSARRSLPAWLSAP